jgi:esterase/lipase superfamily enzyme
MRSKTISIWVLLWLTATVSWFGSAHAQTNRRLGEARVDLASGRAIISLGGGAVDRMQVESIDRAVQITSVSVKYADGRTQYFGSLPLAPGQRSKDLVVRGASAAVAMTLEFRSQPGLQTGIVVYGHATVARHLDPVKPSAERKTTRSPDVALAPPAATPPAPAPTPPPAASRSAPVNPRVLALPSPGAADARSGGPPPAPVPPTAVIAMDTCKEHSICTPVPVFFGTDRKQTTHPDRIDFGADRERQLKLGQAIVTVPRVKRQAGKVLRPTLFETMVLRIPEQGDPSLHFTIPKNGIAVLTEAEFLTAVRSHRATAGTFKDHAFVFVHGYNTSFDSALYRTAQIAFDLSDVAGGEVDRVPFGTAFLYSWPSGGGTVDYVYDHESARGAERHFRDFLDLVISKSGAKQVHLIAHSLGNSVLLNVLQDYKVPRQPAASINQIILAAPAIDAEEFGIIAGKIKGLATGGITLYASSNDRALYAASSLNRGRPMAGDVPSHGPIIVAGVDSIDVSAIPTDSFWGHDRYADRRELLEDIWRLVSKGVRPPDSRSPRYRVEGAGGMTFWRYKP